MRESQQKRRLFRVRRRRVRVSTDPRDFLDQEFAQAADFRFNPDIADKKEESSKFRATIADRSPVARRTIDGQWLLVSISSSGPTCY